MQQQLAFAINTATTLSTTLYYRHFSFHKTKTFTHHQHILPWKEERKQQVLNCFLFCFYINKNKYKAKTTTSILTTITFSVWTKGRLVSICGRRQSQTKIKKKTNECAWTHTKRPYLTQLLKGRRTTTKCKQTSEMKSRRRYPMTRDLNLLANKSFLGEKLKTLNICNCLRNLTS